MQPFTSSSFIKSASAFDDQTAALGEVRPHPTEEALLQLGHALMTELLDVIADTALEDYQTILGEALIGAFHSAAGRIERDADRARDTMRALDRDFDGSEAADVELQEATAKAAEVSRQTAAQKAAGEGSDVVQLSGDGKLLATAMAAAKDSPDVRAAKVRELKEQVKNGTYKPDIQKAARNLIRDDLSQIL